MSWRAMEAVQNYSRYQEPRDYAAFRVMLALASFADERGMVGKIGEYRACPSQMAVAERAHVHRNTVKNLMPRLVDDGELVIVAEGGNGRGTWTVYQIILPMSQQETESSVQFVKEIAQGSRDVEAQSLVQLMGEMAQAMREMAQEIAQLKRLIAQGNGTNSTTLQRERVPDPYIDPGDPERDPGDPRARAGSDRALHDDSPPFSAPQPTLGAGEEDGRQDAARQTGGGAPSRDLVRPVLDGVGRRRAAVRGTAGAIAEVCGLDMRVRSHRKRCEEAAMQLSGYSEAYILARYGPPGGSDGSWNWYLHDWRGRRGEQPEPRLVVETIGKGYVGPGEGSGAQGRQDAARQTGGSAPAVMSNNETTARKYAELRRKLMED